jgi:hypothetical protein
MDAVATCTQTRSRIRLQRYCIQSRSRTRNPLQRYCNIEAPHQKGNNCEAPRQKGNPSLRVSHMDYGIHTVTRGECSRSTSTTRAPHDQDPATPLRAPRACVPHPRLDGFACRHTPWIRAKRHRLERYDQDPAVPSHVPRACAPRQRLVRHDQDPVPRPARHPPARVPRRDSRGQPAGESPHL